MGSTNQILRKQIIYTLAYTTQFGYPLGEEEIKKRLLGVRAVSILEKKHGFSCSESSKKNTKNTSPKEELNLSIPDVLLSLQQEGVIVCSHQKPSTKEPKNELYTLAGHIELFSKREKRYAISQEKQAEITRITRVLSQVSGVVGVALTGSLAMQNSSSMDDDIDLFVVTKSKQLWITRLKVLLASMQNGAKGLPGSKKQDDWCFNLWFTEESLAIPETKQDIYTAYELCQTQWIIDTNNCSQRFFDQNSWVKELLPAFWERIVDQNVKEGEVQKKNNFQEKKSDTSIITASLDFVLFYLQKTYIYFKVGVTTANISRSQAFLHIGNARKTIYTAWSNLIQ